jgi:DNA-binding LacI/PurR family transcriptional regulator
MTISEQDCRRIAAQAGLDVRTVRRVFAGGRSRSMATYAAIEDAAKALKLPGPARASFVPTKHATTNRKKASR